MKFAIYRTSGRALRKAGAAVSKNGGIYNGFTLIEVMVVVIVIGILATLAYSSLVELISTNRAKEVAQTIRTFTERALMDAKRQNKVVRICIKGDAIIAEDTTATVTECGADNSKRISSELFNKSFSIIPNDVPVPGTFKNDVKSEIRIGLSGIAGKGSFAVCDSRGYCGGAGKTTDENSFKAYIRRGNNNTTWRPL
ncbi:MAG: prepilin-type N-terminal cleavage/methylation domain-containing protein [Fibromonadaceae bacterium]|jgi:prepilin-type N-terminal cleavage/methylation domain-containing protein|nr:prepilin-type N-terminal cleavage/methylation domain-containing protein [Fibromonadaceae bacterium]